MNKHEFLRELKNNLIDKIEEEDLQNILMDYDEIFESGKAENKTEDEISHTIGSPSTVSKNILNDYTDNKIFKSNVKINYAPMGKRIAAFIIDSIFSLLPFIIISAPKGIINAFFIIPIIPSVALVMPYTYVNPTNIEIAINLTLLSIFLLYTTVTMIILKNKTIGMLIMNIKVIKSNNSDLKIIDIIIRQFLGKIIVPSLTFGISNIISFFWALFSKSNTTIEDKIASTIVIEDIKGKLVE